MNAQHIYEEQRSKPVRVSPVQHRRLKVMAYDKGMHMRDLINDLIDMAFFADYDGDGPAKIPYKRQIKEPLKKSPKEKTKRKSKGKGNSAPDGRRH